MNRRETVVSIAAGLAKTALPAGAASALAGTAEDVSLQVPAGLPPASFDNFRQLCLWVTGRTEIDRDLLQSAFELMRGEPWGNKHIATAFRDLDTALAEKSAGANVSDLVSQGALQEHERWFVSHLLETLYTGVYEHDGKLVRIAWENALMNSVVADYRAVPGEDAPWRRPGYWSEEP